MRGPGKNMSWCWDTAWNLSSRVLVMLQEALCRRKSAEEWWGLMVRVVLELPLVAFVVKGERLAVGGCYVKVCVGGDICVV